MTSGMQPLAGRRAFWRAGLARTAAWAWPGAFAQGREGVGAVEPSRVLRVLAWPGYADPDIVKAFERRFEVRVEITVVGSDDMLRERLARRDPDTGGPPFDVLAANTVELQRLRDLNQLSPLPLAWIPQAAAQLPRFLRREAIPGLTQGSQLFGMPFTYSEMGLIFDRRQVMHPPESIQSLWDERWRGKVLAFDGSVHNFSIAAQARGLSPFRIPEAQFGPLARHLVALRRNVRAFYTQPDESADLFRRHQVAVMFANYGRQQLKLLREQGLDVGYVLPREGALAWLDCWAITRQARSLTLAARWIDTMLSPEVSRVFSQRQGLANTLEEPPDVAAGAALMWLEPVENEARRIALWQRIRDGDRPERLGS